MTVPEIREYTAMALLGASWLAFVSLSVWVARRFVSRGLSSFNGIRDAIEALTLATQENTAVMELHRAETVAYVERLSREIKEAGRP